MGQIRELYSHLAKFGDDFLLYLVSKYVMQDNVVIITLFYYLNVF